MLVQHVECLFRYFGLERQGRQCTSRQRNRLGWNVVVGRIYYGRYEVGCGSSHQGITNTYSQVGLSRGLTYVMYFANISMVLSSKYTLSKPYIFAVLKILWSTIPSFFLALSNIRKVRWWYVMIVFVICLRRNCFEAIAKTNEQSHCPWNS